MKSLFLSVGLLLVFHTVSVSAFSSYDDVDDVGFERGRRGWSMMRLGRGLQMLRLGKRASLRRLQDKQDELKQQRPSEGDAPAITPEQLRAVLEAILEETRDRGESRRHPPLPRYGRELEVNLDSSDDLLNQDSWRSLPLSYSHHFANSRFKRDASMQGQRPFDDVMGWSEFGNSRSRAVALPRIGRYLGRMYKLRPGKAVPAPRIGRQEDLDLAQQGAQDEHVTKERQAAEFSENSEQKSADGVAAN